jgi:hypothetical protein
VISVPDLSPLLAASTARAAGQQVRTSWGGVMLNSRFRLNMVTALALAINAVAATASLAQQWPTMLV